MARPSDPFRLEGQLCSYVLTRLQTQWYRPLSQLCSQVLRLPCAGLGWILLMLIKQQRRTVWRIRVTVISPSNNGDRQWRCLVAPQTSPCQCQSESASIALHPSYPDPRCCPRVNHPWSPPAVPPPPPTPPAPNPRPRPPRPPPPSSRAWGRVAGRWVRASAQERTASRSRALLRRRRRRDRV